MTFTNSFGAISRNSIIGAVAFGIVAIGSGPAHARRTDADNNPNAMAQTTTAPTSSNDNPGFISGVASVGKFILKPGVYVIGFASGLPNHGFESADEAMRQWDAPGFASPTPSGDIPYSPIVTTAKVYITPLAPLPGTKVAPEAKTVHKKIVAEKPAAKTPKPDSAAKQTITILKTTPTKPAVTTPSATPATVATPAAAQPAPASTLPHLQAKTTPSVVATPGEPPMILDDSTPKEVSLAADLRDAHAKVEAWKHNTAVVANDLVVEMDTHAQDQKLSLGKDLTITGLQERITILENNAAKKPTSPDKTDSENITKTNNSGSGWIFGLVGAVGVLAATTGYIFGRYRNTTAPQRNNAPMPVNENDPANDQMEMAFEQNEPTPRARNRRGIDWFARVPTVGGLTSSTIYTGATTAVRSWFADKWQSTKVRFRNLQPTIAKIFAPEFMFDSAHLPSGAVLDDPNSDVPPADTSFAAPVANAPAPTVNAPAPSDAHYLSHEEYTTLKMLAENTNGIILDTPATWTMQMVNGVGSQASLITNATEPSRVLIRHGIVEILEGASEADLKAAAKYIWHVEHLTGKYIAPTIHEKGHALFHASNHAHSAYDRAMTAQAAELAAHQQANEEALAKALLPETENVATAPRVPELAPAPVPVATPVDEAPARTKEGALVNAASPPPVEKLSDMERIAVALARLRGEIAVSEAEIIETTPARKPVAVPPQNPANDKIDKLRAEAMLARERLRQLREQTAKLREQPAELTVSGTITAALADMKVATPKDATISYSAFVGTMAYPKIDHKEWNRWFTMAVTDITKITPYAYGPMVQTAGDFELATKPFAVATKNEAPAQPQVPGGNEMAALMAENVRRFGDNMTGSSANTLLTDVHHNTIEFNQKEREICELFGAGPNAADATYACFWNDEKNACRFVANDDTDLTVDIANKPAAFSATAQGVHVHDIRAMADAIRLTVQLCGTDLSARDVQGNELSGDALKRVVAAVKSLHGDATLGDQATKITINGREPELLLHEGSPVLLTRAAAMAHTR